MDNLYDEKKSILFILEDARLAGPQVYLARLCSCLKNDFKIEILIPQKDSDKTIKLFNQYNLNYKKLKYFHRPARKFSQILKYVIFFPYELLQLIKILKKNEYDFVYSAGGAWQIKGVIASMFCKSKFIWHLNDSYAPFIIKIFFKIFSHLADGFVFASERTKNYYFKPSSLYKGIVISSPVDFKLIKKNKNFSKIKSKLNIISVANINPIKNIELQIEIAKSLSDISHLVSFNVIGPVYKSQVVYFNKLKNMIQKYNINNFNFLGPSSKVLESLIDFDIYICSSLNESSPISVWEAMSIGLPIISTDVGDINNYIAKKAGLICRDVEDFDHAIRGFIKNNDSLLAMSKNSISISRQHFSIEACAMKHKDFFNSLN